MAKLTNQKVQQVIETPLDLQDSWLHIENIAKICYQSHNNIKEGSAYKMLNKLIDLEHTAMLEHSWLVFRTKVLTSKNISEYLDTVQAFVANNNYIYYTIKDGRIYIMGNYRAFMECDYKGKPWNPLKHNLKTLALSLYKDFDLPELENQMEFEIPNELKAYTAILLTDRAVTHELVRHRPASFAQESQRYVRYDGDMLFIKPSWYDKANEGAKHVFIDDCKQTEYNYGKLRKLGYKPQDARVVLSNQVASQIAVTAPIWEWEHIFKLRCSKEAYTQIRNLMNEVKKGIQIIENEYR